MKKIVHGMPISPYVRKTRVALELKGIEYERTDVFPGTKTPEFLALSPLGKIPAFEDGELIMCDSNVMVEYLEEQYPEIPIRPTSPVDRARSRWLEEYGAVLFNPCAEDVFMSRMTTPFTSGEPEDSSIAENAIKNLQPPLFDYVEAQLPEQGFLFGDFTIADISLVSPLINASYADWSVDSERWPKLSAFLARVIAHPAVAKCMEAENPIIEALTSARNERLANAG